MVKLKAKLTINPVNTDQNIEIDNFFLDYLGEIFAEGTKCEIGLMDAAMRDAAAELKAKKAPAEAEMKLKTEAEIKPKTEPEVNPTAEPETNKAKS